MYIMCRHSCLDFGECCDLVMGYSNSLLKYDLIWRFMLIYTYKQACIQVYNDYTNKYIYINVNHVT